jgi:DNA polymerase-4
VLDTARLLLAGTEPLVAERGGLTLLGLALTNLEPAVPEQPELPFGADDGALDRAVDRVRDRFGSRAVGRTVLQGRDPDLTVPLLPD